MKVLGVEIYGREVRLGALEETNGIVSNYTGKYKPVSLENDDTADNVILFKTTLHAIFDGYNPDVIVIKYRNPNGKGMHAPSPLSFKIEGLIQIYDKAQIYFTKPQTTSAFYKKNHMDIAFDYSYQEDAIKLAHHYLKTKV